MTKKKKTPIKKTKIENLRGDELYKSLVAKAKEVLDEIKEKRVEIARLCVRACHIQKGGHKAKGGGARFYSLCQFADDVGVHRKTLSGWVDTYQKVINKFPEDKEWTEHEFKAASKIKKRIKGGENRDQLSKMILEEKDGPSVYARFERLKKNSRFFWFTVKNDNLKKISKSEKEWLRDEYQKMADKLTELI